MVDVSNAGPWTVGIPRNDYFTGRDTVLEQLRAQLVCSGRAAVTGLGGIGKTQIAAEYAYRFRDRYRAVYWVNAADPPRVACSLMQIAEALELPEYRLEDEGAAVEAARRHLESTEDWLMIYDSADEPAFLKRFMPRFGGGHVIVTSRAQVLDFLGIPNPLEISALEPDEALHFMLRRTGRENAAGKERAGAQLLVEKLGYLPLALEQAGAYIAGKQSRFESYVEAYDGQCLELLERARPVTGDPEKSVTTTWIIAFESLAPVPVAADILATSSFLAAEEIPIELLQCGSPELGPSVSAFLKGAAGDLRLDEALEPLTRYSLIHRNILGRTFTVHRLVQEVARNRMTAEDRRMWSSRAIRALSRVFPNDEFEGWNLCERLVPHVRQMAYWKDEIAPSVEVANLFSNTGRYLFRRGKYSEAEAMHEQALSLRQALLGPRHLDVATSLSNLGNVYFGEGRYEESEAMHKRALAIREELLGSNDPDVAASLNNIANAYHLRGKFSEAEILHRRAIAVKERAFGANHPDMALSLDNFGTLFYDQGRYAEAEPLHRRALEIREHALGPEHPFVAASLDNLATAYRRQGKYAEAESLHRRAAEIHERTLGPNHHYLAESLESLANVYRHQHRFEEAESLCKRAIGIYQRTLGAEHPDYARSLNELAALYRAQRRTAEANSLHERALEIVERVWGKDHPFWVQMQEDFERSEPRNARIRGKNALTPREREVATHVAQGRSNRAIAGALSLSERTVESHVASILAKRRMSSRGEIAAYVLKESPYVPPV